MLNSARFLINIAGTANLGSELLALSVRPMLRTTGTGVVVPVRVDGTFRNPRVTLNAPLGGATAVSYPSEHGADACGPALAAVRAHPTSVPVAPAASIAAAPASATVPASSPVPLAPSRPNP